jgi:hypothetical protein
MIPALVKYISAMYSLSGIFTNLEAATSSISENYLKNIEEKKDEED